MKYFIGGILALLGAAMWAGSIYVDSNIQYQVIYWILKAGLTFLGIIISFWILHVFMACFDNGYPHHDKGSVGIYIGIIISLVIFIGIQYSVWGSVYITRKIDQLASTISDHVEFPGGGQVPRFYIGEKPSK